MIKSVGEEIACANMVSRDAEGFRKRQRSYTLSRMESPRSPNLEAHLEEVCSIQELARIKTRNFKTLINSNRFENLKVSGASRFCLNLDNRIVTTRAEAEGVASDRMRQHS